MAAETNYLQQINALGLLLFDLDYIRADVD